MKRGITTALAIATALTTPSCAEESDGTVWENFKYQSGDYILPDFSYAGYKCGEVAIPEVEELGYKQFDITDFGAVPNDEVSDREPFKAVIAAVEANGGGVIYIPEGQFELHAEGDPDETIHINSSNTVIRGAGRDKSTLLFSAPFHPTNPKQLWTSPTAVGFTSTERSHKITTITADAKRGDTKIQVASAEGVKAGNWINLTLTNNDPELGRSELGDYYDQLSESTSIKRKGVHVDDYHEIKSVDGDIVTLVEPIIYPIESRWGWEVESYPHLTGVGIEDIAIEGDCVADYVHHRTWNDDGGYKPFYFSHAVDSWIRRVDFVSVSEAMSITSSARCSAYDINIRGKRGHAAIHAQNSVRTFIGKVIDQSNSQEVEGAGQWHAVGVTKHTLGTVLWRNEWGTDANFESHATQPRATLIDACRGGFLRLRQGGAESELPNHLGDLVIWNFDATASEPERAWQWWDSETKWTRFLPAIVVGYHGAELTFDPTQTLIEESHGTPVEPESLYEAQLIERLGALPEWLVALKR